MLVETAKKKIKKPKHIFKVLNETFGIGQKASDMQSRAVQREGESVKTFYSRIHAYLSSSGLKSEALFKDNMLMYFENGIRSDIKTHLDKTFAPTIEASYWDSSQD
jgi:hypothetical protein